MGRKSLFGGKAEHIMISISAEDKKFVEEKGISPSKFFQEAIVKFREGTNDNSKNMEFDSDIEKVRAVFVRCERGTLDKDKYFLAIKIFMDKWVDVTKPEVMARVERARYYTEKEELKEVEGNESL